MGDGARLPTYRWLPRGGDPNAVILAVHGFNDHAMAFDVPGRWFAAHGLAVYAHDQRGFGGSPGGGAWAGEAALVRDLAAMVRLVQQRHPGTPVYLLGSSMGGAVILAAAARGALPEVAGTVLAAPAVWARRTMPWYQRWALWVGARTLPWLRVGGGELNIRASDNDAALRTLALDPRVRGTTRVGTLHGLTNLMDTALGAAAEAPTPLLTLYGENDEIVPAGPMRRFRRHLPEAGVTNRTYETGWHLLLRDRRADRVWRDIAAWVRDSGGEPPSRVTAR